MKFVTVIFAAFAYICSSSVSVGAQLCTQNEVQSKYNQTSFYDMIGDLQNTRVNEINCTTGKKIRTIDFEAQGNKLIISSSKEDEESLTCENKEAFKGFTLADYDDAIESLDGGIIFYKLFIWRSELFNKV